MTVVHGQYYPRNPCNVSSPHLDAVILAHVNITPHGSQNTGL